MWDDVRCMGDVDAVPLIRKHTNNTNNTNIIIRKHQQRETEIVVRQNEKRAIGKGKRTDGMQCFLLLASCDI